MSMLTAQQHRAVHTRGVSVVLSSGAGCGKTHVLTERYLSHLRLDGAEVGQIVAITFTDRAARQMRGRIRRAITVHLRSAGTEEEAAVWARHLRALENAPISTIHAFCGTLLRQHAVEAGLEPGFDVLEEVLAVNLRTEAITTCLQRLVTATSQPGEDLRQLILLYGWHPVVEAIHHLLHDWDEQPWTDWLARPVEEIARFWIERGQKEILPRHLAHLIGSRPAITRCLDLLRRHPPLPGAMSAPVALLLEETPRLAQAADLPAAIERLVEAARVGRAGSKAWPDPGVYEAIKKAFEDFRDTLRGLSLDEFDVDPAALQLGAETSQRFLRVAGEAMRHYGERKRQHGVADFQDLLLRARDLLRRQPEVRARLQDRYRFLLIDELQDTDPVQMELVEALAGGGLSGGKLFAVGDHKQSIYRFRGADVALFRALRQRVPLEGRQALSVNFRSQPAILDFANALLGPFLDDYEPLTAHQPQRSGGPCIEFLWSPRPEGARAHEARASEAEWLARRLASLIGQEGVVADEASGQLRPVRAGDIVLLFRAMSHVPLYESALRRQGLDYYLVGGRAFFAQQEIYDLLHLLRALENPQDALSLAGALRSPFGCLSDEALFVLARHRQGLWAGLFDEHLATLLPAGQLPRVERIRRHLMRWRGLKDRLPIARLLAEVFADSGYDAATQFEFLGERKLANLWKLQELARTFDRSGLFGLAEFIARLADLVAVQPREEQAATQPENADVVRLMSIHQAKGLEFPIVIVPDVAAQGGSSYRPVARWDARLGCVVRPPADDDPLPFPPFVHRVQQAWDDLEEWAEDLRTLYVACTRPRDYLILSAACGDNDSPAGPWMQTLASRFDLTTGICRAEEIPPARRPRVRVFHPDHPPPAPPAVRQESLPLPEAPPPLPQWTPGPESGPVAVIHPYLAETDRFLRQVLSRWDWRDPNGWKGPLQRLGGRVRGALASLLERLAATAFRERLAAAVKVRREVEYVVQPAEGPTVLGHIDCLWQDGTGAWHVAEWVTTEVPPGEREAFARSRQKALELAVAALQQHTAVEVRSTVLVFLYGGTTLEQPTPVFSSCALPTERRHRIIGGSTSRSTSRGGTP